MKQQCGRDWYRNIMKQQSPIEIWALCNRGIHEQYKTVVCKRWVQKQYVTAVSYREAYRNNMT